MALSTYVDLLSAIPNHISRLGDNALSSVLPDLVTMFEAKANSLLRVGDMEANALGSSTNGILVLPDDFLGWRRVTHATAGPLVYLDPQQAAAMHPNDTSGSPAYFTVLGSLLVTYPAVTDDLSLDYYAKLPPLASNATNWLLTKRPDIYLNGVKAEAYLFAKNYDEAKAHTDLVTSLIDAMNKQDAQTRYPYTMNGSNP